MAANVLTATKSELITAFIQKELLENSSMRPYVRDLSSLVTKGFNQVSIPKLNAFTPTDRAFGAAATENAALAATKDTIDLNINQIVLFGYDSHDEQQSSINYLMEAASNAARALGRSMSAKIVAEWESVASLSVNAAIPADITAANILDMREHMIKGFADMGRVTLKIAADQEKAMLKLAEFSRYDYRGGNAPLVNGMIGTVYGVPVVINQAIKAQQAIMSEDGGVAIAFQKEISMQEQDDVSYGTGGKKVAVDVVYGLGGLQIEEAGAAATKSPLVAILTN